MKNSKMLAILLFALCLMVCQAKVSEAAPIGTVFTYKGNLTENRRPVSGLYNFEFKLYDNPGPFGGRQVGRPIRFNDLEVIDGHFIVALDFGTDIFTGDARWLETTVEQSDGSNRRTLRPREKLILTPYSLYAQEAAYAQGAADLIMPYLGTVSNGAAAFSVANTGTGYAGDFEQAGSENTNGGLNVTTAAGRYGAKILNQGGNSSSSYGLHVTTKTGTGSNAYGIVIDADNSKAPDGASYGIQLVSKANGQAFGIKSNVRVRTSGIHPLYGIYSYGDHTGTDGTSYGMWSKVYGSDGGDSYGIHSVSMKRSSDTAGTAYGGYFIGYNDRTGGESYGVYGEAEGSGGKNYGVYGKTNSSIGYGGYFEGRGYFSGNVGIGMSEPAEKLEVAGNVRLVGSNDITGVLMKGNGQGGGGEIQLYNNTDETKTVSILAAEGGTNGAEIKLMKADGTTTIELDAEYGDVGRIITDELITTGNVGIGIGGTTEPAEKLEVAGNITASQYYDRDDTEYFMNPANRDKSATFAGKVGIGTLEPSGKLHVVGNVRLDDYNGIIGMLLRGDGQGDGGEISMYDFDKTKTVSILAAEGGTNGAEIKLMKADGTTTIELDAEYEGDGRIITQELQITGGSDLSEQFGISGEIGKVKPGMVVCIDVENPGSLVVSKESYDRTVAGIISGAGGVKPGMLMGQKGTTADGEHPVALTGRVYCWADASNGPIEPGNLLTTSDMAGHAMKVTDYTKAQGAILGKAMSSLEQGKGLVLVLITLQ
ncbi:MAG: hypothetical protein GY774_25805 [Planctomycetes bacterium]|nr:hypothetical protein [Planctomycetota bacterium]